MYQFFNFLSWRFLAVIFFILCIFGIYLLSKSLIKKHAEYIRGAWYLYFLLGVITILVGMVCHKIGFIDAKGEFHGSGGNFLNKVLNFVFALNEDMMAACGIVSLIVIPQFGSYFFSGMLSGCAVPPKHTGFILKFALFNLAKSFVIAAGVLLGLSVLSGILGWNGVSEKNIVGMYVLSAFVLLLGFYLLSSFGEIKIIEESKKDVKIVTYLRKFHFWMMRNIY